MWLLYLHRALQEFLLITLQEQLRFTLRFSKNCNIYCLYFVLHNGDNKRHIRSCFGDGITHQMSSPTQATGYRCDVVSLALLASVLREDQKSWLAQRHLTSKLENWHLISFCWWQGQCSFHTISLSKINNGIFYHSFWTWKWLYYFCWLFR